MRDKTEYELLKEQLNNPRGPTPEEAKRYYDDRMNNQPPPGADSQGNIRIYKSKADIPADVFEFEIIGDDEEP